MSSLHQLSFPPVDSLVLSDFPHLSDLDVPDDIFLSNDIEEITDDTMLHDLDAKVDLPIPELNDFSIPLGSNIKQGAEEDSGGVCPSAANDIPFDGFNLDPMPDFSSAEDKPVLPASHDPTDESPIITDMIMSSGAEAGDNSIGGYPSTMLATTHDQVSLEERPSPQDSSQTSIGITNPITMGNTSIRPCLAQNIELTTNVPKLLPIVGFNNGSRNSQINSTSLEPNSGFPSLMPGAGVAPSTPPHSMMTIATQADAMAINIPPPVFQISSSPVSTPTSSAFSTKHKSSSSVTSSDPSSSFTSIPSPRGDASQSMQSAPAKETQDHPIMQRSQSSHSLGQLRSSPGNLSPCPEKSSLPQLEIQIPGFSNLSPFTYYQASSPVFVEGTPVRRVFSTGDLQALNGMHVCYRSTNPCQMEHPNNEDTLGLKIGHYTVEERKERLHRYRQKRNERNFSKKIKYACRKTLADSRPRVRGRFARTLDDSGELLAKENGASPDNDYKEGSARMNVNGKCSMVKEPGAMHWKPLRMNFAMGHGV